MTKSEQARLWAWRVRVVREAACRGLMARVCERLPDVKRRSIGPEPIPGPTKGHEHLYLEREALRPDEMPEHPSDDERDRLGGDHGKSSRAVSAPLLFEHRDQLTQVADLWRRRHTSQIHERVGAALIRWLAQPSEHGAHPLDLRDLALPTDIEQTNVFVDVVPE